MKPVLILVPNYSSFYYGTNAAWLYIARILTKAGIPYEGRQALEAGTAFTDAEQDAYSMAIVFQAQSHYVPMRAFMRGDNIPAICMGYNTSGASVGLRNYANANPLLSCYTGATAASQIAAATAYVDADGNKFYEANGIIYTIAGGTGADSSVYAVEALTWQSGFVGNAAKVITWRRTQTGKQPVIYTRLGGNTSPALFTFLALKFLTDELGIQPRPIPFVVSIDDVQLMSAEGVQGLTDTAVYLRSKGAVAITGLNVQAEEGSGVGAFTAMELEPVRTVLQANADVFKIILHDHARNPFYDPDGFGYDTHDKILNGFDNGGDHYYGYLDGVEWLQERGYNATPEGYRGYFYTTANNASQAGLEAMMLAGIKVVRTPCSHKGTAFVSSGTREISLSYEHTVDEITTRYWLKGHARLGLGNYMRPAKSYEYGLNLTAWAHSETVAVGTIVKPTTANGMYYVALTPGGHTGDTEPVWKTDGTPTTDGAFSWERHWLGELLDSTTYQVLRGQNVQSGGLSTAVSIGSYGFQQRILSSIWFHASLFDDGWAARVAAGQMWVAETEYDEGAIVVPTYCNGFYYVADNAGTSGLTEPVWVISEGTADPVNNAAVDGDITWTRLAYGATVQIFAGDNPALEILQLFGTMCDISGGWLKFAGPADFDMLCHPKRRKL